MPCIATPANKGHSRGGPSGGWGFGAPGEGGAGGRAEAPAALHLQARVLLETRDGGNVGGTQEGLPVCLLRLPDAPRPLLVRSLREGHGAVQLGEARFE